MVDEPKLHYLSDKCCRIWVVPLASPWFGWAILPSSSTPACSHFLISRTTRAFATRCSMNSHQPVVFDGVEELRTAGGVMRLWDAAGYLAAGLVITAFCMKGMVPLRVVALTSNVAFLVYGIGLGLVPVWLLHAILLPVNSWRLWQRIARRPTAEAPEARLEQAGVVTECEGGGPLLDDEAHDLHSARRPGRCSERGSSRHNHKPAGINPVT